jgi:hypothetical protein
VSPGRLLLGFTAIEGPERAEFKSVGLFPRPLLSFHPVRELVDPTYVVVSAASSHRTHPDTENVDANVFPIPDRSDHVVTCPVVVDEMVVVA